MIDVPIAQSIRFRPLNSDLPNFDNTFDGIETDRSRTIIPYRQYLGLDEIKIQVAASADALPLKMLVLYGNNQVSLLSNPGFTIVGDTTYWQFEFPAYIFVNELCRLELNTLDQLGYHPIYRTEPFEVKDQPTFLKIEWFNHENAFLMDYSTGIVHQMWIDAELVAATPGGEISIFLNQGRATKLKEIVRRVANLECRVPHYIAEQLTLAMAHDRFYVNEIEYTNDKKAPYDRMGNSNLFAFTAELTQRNAVGINTHDTGFNVV